MTFYALVLCLVIAATYAQAEGEKDVCCYPNQLSGDTYSRGRKVNTFNIDYDRKMIVEEWNGFLGIDFVVYDMAAMKQYRVYKRGGRCRVLPLKPGSFDQCTPDDAEHEAHPEVDGHEMMTYRYTTSGVIVEKTVQAESCLPSVIKKTRGGRTLSQDFTDVSEGVNDSAFDKDISACE